MNNVKIISVITGDIVNSSILDDNQKRVVQDSVCQLNYENILLKPKFFRGDSFQLAVKPEIALILALKIRADLRRRNQINDVRVSIGIGEILFWNENVLLSEGPAFERSGKKLDKLKKLGVWIAITTGDQELDEELETYCFMADVLLKNLSSAQANVLYHKLDKIPQERIGKLLNISQPSVCKTLKAANWKAIDKFIKRYKQIIEKKYGAFE
ncbi:hypothetical protein JW964_08605 [candidate division KSB1 bacterium]|nr:hypothetical protein [candidate division KSB1 bacterium]